MRYFATSLFPLVAFLLPWFIVLKASFITENITSIGVILDQSSRPGKEARVAIEIAVQDLKNKINQPLVLYFQNSLSKPSRAAIAAKQLVDGHNVTAILGGHTWEEASAIAEVISEADDDIAFVSLSDKTQSTQMNAVAAILQSWSMHQVTLIYEASSSSTSSASIIYHLSNAFRETGCVISHIVPLITSCSLKEELEVLRSQQRKVFVIHTSIDLAIRLYQTAKKIEMTGEGYLWIATNDVTNHFHSINSTSVSSLKGIIGVKSYSSENTPDFRKRFRNQFHTDFPDERQEDPGIFAVQGYDAVKLLKKILENNDSRGPVGNIVEIVYMIGNGYHSVYWTQGSGFSETVEEDITYNHFLHNVGQLAVWPVQPWYAHRRSRNLAESSEIRMRVGVPVHSLFKQFVNIEFDTDKNQTKVSGFVIAVFFEMMRELKLPYEFFPFNGSYDELIRQIPAKFDAVAGDITIMSKKQEYVDFTQPFTESGLEMIVPVRSRPSNHPWLFMKPFTAKMWWLIATITLYNGFIIWLIERSHCEHLQGSVITQAGIIIWLAFTTLFTLRGDKLHSNMSRIAMVMWLFVALIITQSYTASFASMLTAQKLEPMITSVEMLRSINATVGYCSGSLVHRYLKDVLKFPSININSYNSTHRYAEALNRGEIAAIFLEVPTAKVFLTQYCKSFIRTGQTFKMGGFGFAFPKNFSMLSMANQALMSITESGRLKELEEAFLTSDKCVEDDGFSIEDERLSPHSFMTLFELTGGTSTVALVMYIIRSIKIFREHNPEPSSFYKLILAYIKHQRHQMGRSSSVVVDAEIPTRPLDVPHPWI